MHPIKAYREAHPDESGKPMSLESFGALVGVGKSVVSKWESGIDPSPESTVAIDKATRGEVPRWKLRPDLWDAPERVPA